MVDPGTLFQLDIPDNELNENVHDINNKLSQCNYHSLSERLDIGNSFNVLHINARSMRNKFDDIQTMLNNSGVEWSVICISETWLKNGIEKFFNINEYELYTTSREKCRGGGTAIYVNKKHESHQRQDLELNNLENSVVEIQLNCASSTKTILVCGIYKSPSILSTSFLTSFEELLDKMGKERKLSIVAGDFNYDLLKLNTCNASELFLNLLQSYNFFPTISKPTRIQREHESLIDNIFLNDFKTLKSSGILLEDLSDHLPIFIDLHIHEKKSSSKTNVSIFDFRRIDELREYLVTKLRNFQHHTDAEEACNDLVNTFKAGINMFSRQYSNSRRKDPIHPWISPSILCCINRKNKLYKKHIKNKSNALAEQEYKTYKNILTSVIREAKKLYYQEEFKKSKNNGKKTWKTLNALMNKEQNRNTTYPTTFYDNDGNTYIDKEVPDAFNYFFSSIGNVLDRKIPITDTDPLSYLTLPTYEPLCDLPVVSEQQIEQILKSLNTVGAGVDGISSKILLATYNSILSHLTFFFNLCLANSVFPKNLKKAVIIPIHKANEKNKFNNYRPISILPILSKVLEKILHGSISQFLLEHGVLHNYQFGFRKHHCTYMPIAHIFNDATNAHTNNEILFATYLDLAKAFDTVSIDILLKKLHHIGIRDSTYRMLVSYLSERTQRTKINDMISSEQLVEKGVPQGSILGPLLFIIYINDICNISHEAKFLLFADDTAITLRSKNITELQKKIDTLAPKIALWFQTNRLSLNVNKSNYQIYSRNLSNDVTVSLNNGTITRKACVKYLGIYIDEDLRWNSHITHVASVISRNIGVLSKVKYFLSSAGLRLLYHSLIMPYINYCCVIWGNTSKTRLNRLIILQKRALRIIDHRPYFYPSNELFIKLELLKLPDIIEAQILSIVLAKLNGRLPPSVDEFFNYHHGGNTRIVQHFELPFAATKYRTYALPIIGPKTWNKVVPASYRTLEDVPRNKIEFKKFVHKYFIDKYKELSNL